MILEKAVDHGEHGEHAAKPIQQDNEKQELMWGYPITHWVTTKKG